MATNPLEELIKSRAPAYPTFSAGQEAVSTNVNVGGNYQVNVAPLPKTNAALQFAEALREVPRVYGSIVETRQRDAALDVARMDEGEFKDAYQKIIGGDVEAASLFGYTKAHQQKIVERYHSEVVPLELKDLSRKFKNKLNDYSSIAEFDGDVEFEVDNYYRELGKKFDASPFSQEAHELLSIGKAAKLKVELHEAYEAQALDFIRSQSIDNVVKTIEDYKGNYDGDMSKPLQQLFKDAVVSTGGDKSSANGILLSGVSSFIEQKLSEGTSQSIEEAGELFEVMFESAVRVNGKEIFETQNAAKEEIALRTKIVNAQFNHPAKAQANAKSFNAGWIRQVRNTDSSAEREAKISEWLTAAEQIEDNLTNQYAIDLREEYLTSPRFSEDEAANTYIDDFNKKHPEKAPFDKAVMLSIITGKDLAFTQTEQEILLPLSQDGTSTVPSTEYLELEREASTEYIRLRRQYLGEVYFNDYATDEERTAAGLEAREKAYDETLEYIQTRARQLVEQAKPKKETDQKIRDLRAYNATPKQIEQYQKLREQNSPAAEEYFETVKETRLGDDIKDLYTEKPDGSASIDIRDWWVASSDYVQISENFNKLVQARVFKDDKNLREQHQRVLEFINSKSKVGDESIYMALANGEQQGYKDMFTLIQLRGVSDEEFLTGVVSGSYMMLYPDVSPAGGGSGLGPRSQESSNTFLDMILVEGGLFSDDIDKFPIAIDGDINKTIAAVMTGADFAFDEIAEKLGVKPNTVLEAQKAYLKTLGYFPEDNTDDNDDDPTDEKKSNDGIESAVDVQTVGGMGDLNDLDPSGAQFKIQENYPFVQLDEDKEINTFRTTPKDFMKQYYVNNVTNHPQGEAGVRRAFEKKFKDMTTRDPRLLELENKIVTMSFDMPLERYAQGTKGNFNQAKGTGDHHITISPNLDYKEMEQVILHELVHSLQFNRKNRGDKLNYVTGDLDKALGYTPPSESFTGYLQSLVESEARFAEVARRYTEKTGKFIAEDLEGKYDTSSAFVALLDFMTDPNIPDQYKRTQGELYEVLNLKTTPMDELFDDDERKPHKEALMKELMEIPRERLKLLLGSISTLASNNPIQNSNQQLA